MVSNSLGKTEETPGLRSRIVAVLLAVSLLPLCLVGVGSWIVFERLLEQKSFELQRTIVESHSRAIESYLDERLNSLQLIVSTSTLSDLIDSSNLRDHFDILNLTSNNGFVDLGVIGSDGEHLAYVGPYDLMGRNYRQADWFKQVMTEGTYISDVFLGFRQIPHCIIAIIAVKNSQGDRSWILRATINSDQFDQMVRTGMLGETGDVFIVNRDGLYQTTPRVGSILDASPLTDLDYFQGVRDRKLKVNGSLKIQVTTWINQNHWLLVAQQDAAEVRAPVTRAITYGALIVLGAVILLVVTTFFATGHLTYQIDRANERREEMFRAFMRSAKLASLGELATGFAHEINNPLAVISADQTNITDIVSALPDDFEERREVLETLERSKKQVQRCKSITTRMLQFGRQHESELKPTDIGKGLREIVDLLERQARVGNVELKLSVEENLPLVLIDPIELEQVMVNLINNSFQALPQGGHIDVQVRREDNWVDLEVKDDGSGIPPEILERIFEPFFTTKPVGKGTGLGLSVCYGIVQLWEGRIEAKSQPGKGTTMLIRIPIKEGSHREGKSAEVSHG